MFTKYLITGGSGFLGSQVVAALKDTPAEIRALVLEKDPLAEALPSYVRKVTGDVRDAASLDAFFAGADAQTCVIHCAGIVSVASKPDQKLYDVNVGGTRNVLAHCRKIGVGKLVHVSSVHAIPEKPKGVDITEDAVFSPDLVQGEYAKSKAMATALVLEAAREGLNASVVFPSGIIGPHDRGEGSISQLLLSYLSGRLPLAVKGGYSFVDVRDVAAGIMACTERGLAGQGYILSGPYATIQDILEATQKASSIQKKVHFLPIRLAKLVAPFYEKWCLMRHQPLFFTPYAVEVLDSNGRFSCQAAESVLGFSPRSLESSIRDMVLWLKEDAAL